MGIKSINTNQITKLNTAMCSVQRGDDKETRCPAWRRGQGDTLSGVETTRRHTVRRGDDKETRCPAWRRQGDTLSGVPTSQGVPTTTQTTTKYKHYSYSINGINIIINGIITLIGYSVFAQYSIFSDSVSNF